jgi:hypothetical protein
MKILLRLMNHPIFGAVHVGDCLSSITQTSSGIFYRFLGLVYPIRDMEPTTRTYGFLFRKSAYSGVLCDTALQFEANTCERPLLRHFTLSCPTSGIRGKMRSRTCSAAQSREKYLLWPCVQAIPLIRFWMDVAQFLNGVIALTRKRLRLSFPEIGFGAIRACVRFQQK